MKHIDFSNFADLTMPKQSLKSWREKMSNQIKSKQMKLNAKYNFSIFT